MGRVFIYLVPLYIAKNGIYNLCIEKFLLSLRDLSYVRGCFACEWWNKTKLQLYLEGTYYQNGKFATTDATATFAEDKDRIERLGMADQIVQDCTSFLNEVLDGLDKVYAEKGYPIK